MSHLAQPTTLEYADDDAKSSFGGISTAGWLTIATVTALMAATFRFNLVRLWGKLNFITGESEWQHGLLVPCISLYFLYLHKDELLKTPVRPLLAGSFTRNRWISAGVLALVGAVSLFVLTHVLQDAAKPTVAGRWLLGLAGLVVVLDWGLALMIWGLAFFAYGIFPGQNDYFKDVGMLTCLFGVVLTLAGWKVMRIAWFPVVFLICAIPWPGLVYSKLALPLQELAAKVAANIIALTGIDAYESGSKIHIGSHTLNVAEACAGLKSLMTFFTLAGAIAFLRERPLWQRLVITFSAVPIAVFCNVMRVTVQGFFDYYGGTEWSENFAHQFVGMVMLIPALLLVLAVAWAMDKLFVEEGDEDVIRAATAAARASVAARSMQSAPPASYAKEHA